MSTRLSTSSEWLYSKLPVFMQNAVCAEYGRRQLRSRFGPLFTQYCEFLASSEWWSESDIAAYQDEQLASVVRYAYDNVPFYRTLLRQHKLTPRDIRSRGDLPKLPVLTKELVRENQHALMSLAARPRELEPRHTSGTTGKSLHFFVARRAVPFMWAVWWRHRRRFGLAWGAQHVNFTGKRVVPLAQRKPPYWRWCTPLNQALISMHHITSANVHELVAFLDEHEFEFFTGYPSIIHTLAQAALDVGLPLHRRPKVVVTGAENVLVDQRRDIVRWTGARITDQYGFSEACGNASQCPLNVYHVDAEVGIFECVDAEPVDAHRVRGKIVCTGFLSPEFPFIRYEVGDWGVWPSVPHRCQCGRATPVIFGIDGRQDDYVVTPEGRRIMRFDYLFKDTVNVREAQVVQRERGEILIRIARRSAYSQRDEKYIEQQVRAWISERLKVSFEYVPEIERERNGKFRAVRSYLSTGPQTQ